MNSDDKSNTSAAIDSAISALKNRYGENMVIKMDDSSIKSNTVSTGRPNLDQIIGGGIPVGKIIEILGKEACGKTGLALEIIASVQREGGRCLIVDSEHALNKEYAEQIGVDISSLLVAQPSYGEQAFEIVRAMINTSEIDLIIVDSVSAMIPKAELEGESGEQKIALQARMMSQGCKMIVGVADTVGTTVVFINQMRSTLAHYGAADTTTGGNALKYYASQRFEVKNIGQIRQGEEVIGFKQRIRCIKNKIAPPFKQIETDIIYGQGSDNIHAVIEALISKKILVQKSAYFYFEGTNIAQGMKKLKSVLADNPELYETLKSKL